MPATKKRRAKKSTTKKRAKKSPAKKRRAPKKAAPKRRRAAKRAPKKAAKKARASASRIESFHGFLYDFKTGDMVRQATKREASASKRARKANGVINVNGRAVYVGSGT